MLVLYCHGTLIEGGSAMAKLQSQSTSNPTSIVQKAAVAALKGPQECVEQMKREYIDLRDQVVNGLRSIPGVTCTMPEGAFYAYPNVSSFFGRGVKSASDVAGRLLREAHVAAVPGEGFGTRDPAAGATQHGAGVLAGGTIPAIPYTSQSKAWGAAPSEPARDALSIKATNVAHVTIDAKRANVDCNAQLNVTTDGPLTVTLAECHGKSKTVTASFG